MATVYERMNLIVHQRRVLTDSICEFDLRSVDGLPLKPFSAGGSLILRTPSGEQRNYSLCNSTLETHRYVIAVKREVDSRGGSRSMHDEAMPGTVISGELARKGLHLGPGQRHLLIAGGIGITPILSLVRALVCRQDDSFRVFYLARSRFEAAYANELLAIAGKARATLHFSEEHKGARLDLRPLLRDNGTGEHLYYCGPSALMRQLGQMSIHWPRSRVHFEEFSPAPRAAGANEAFWVKQSSTGQVFRVAEDQSILDALRAAGKRPAASCESGTCGKCRMGLVSGEADHRDMYLTPEERESALMPCVSRAAEDATLELDF